MTPSLWELASVWNMNLRLKSGQTNTDAFINFLQLSEGSFFAPGPLGILRRESGDWSCYNGESRDEISGIRKPFRKTGELCVM